MSDIKVSVVIPVHDHWNLTHSLLFDLHNLCRKNLYEVVVVNDASKEVDHYKGMEWWMSNAVLPIFHLDSSWNVGFLKASNIGLKTAKGGIKILISNDVHLHENIIPKIIESLREPKTLVGSRLLTQSTGWNEFDGRVFPYLEGWLLATTSESWRELGYFDEQFAPNDYEDIDLSTTAVKKEYRLVDLALHVDHLGAQSIPYSPEREEVTKANREKFRQKWLK